MQSLCTDTSVLTTFSENHDNPRFASYTSDFALAKNIIAFTILSDGIPIIYQGQEQHLNGSSVPYNREAIWSSDHNTSAELYIHVAKLNAIRSQAIALDEGHTTAVTEVFYTDASTMAMRKGSSGKQVITVLNNLGEEGASYNLSLAGTSTGLGSKVQMTDIVGCGTVTTGTDGSLEVPMEGGLPRVYYPSSMLTGSGLCGSVGTGNVVESFEEGGCQYVVVRGDHTPV